MSVVLAADALSVHYGGIAALVNVDLTVRESQLVGLIGPNGAGKTTFVDTVTGFTRHASGRVLVDGEDVSSLAPQARAQRGLARTWQSTELFDELTVGENLAVAGSRPTWRQSARELLTGRRIRDPHVDEVLSLLDLGELADLHPESLTNSQRKLVGVARAIVSEPRVVCLDEPAAGLDTNESLVLGRHLRRLVEEGTAVLLIDHDMGLVLTICDHVFVLESGKILASGSPETVRADPRVVAAYLGRGAAEVVGPG